jgi:hypothetical protein
VEDGWAEGPLVPEEPFGEFRELFAQEASLRNDQIIPLWEEVADRIAALGIQVMGDDGVVHPRLRVFVEGNEAILARPTCPQ